MAIRIDDTRFICRKTYTNGKDYEVKEDIFCLTVVYERTTKSYRVVNLTHNMMWEMTYGTISDAVEAIKTGSWAIIDERRPNRDYTFNEYQKNHQYDIPRKTMSLVYDRYPDVSVRNMKDLYAVAVDMVLNEAGVKYIDEGDLSWGRGLLKAQDKLFELLSTFNKPEGKKPRLKPVYSWEGINREY